VIACFASVFDNAILSVLLTRILFNRLTNHYLNVKGFLEICQKDLKGLNLLSHKQWFVSSRTNLRRCVVYWPAASIFATKAFLPQRNEKMRKLFSPVLRGWYFLTSSYEFSLSHGELLT